MNDELEEIEMVDNRTQEQRWIEADAGDAMMRERAARGGYDDRTPRERREDRAAIDRYKRSAR